jgi:hypothetical protein
MKPPKRATIGKNRQVVALHLRKARQTETVRVRYLWLAIRRFAVVAKTYFMLQKSGKPASLTQLSESAKELGWNAAVEDNKESISFLEKLGLVKREAKPKRGLGEAHDKQSG